MLERTSFIDVLSLRTPALSLRLSLCSAPIGILLICLVTVSTDFQYKGTTYYIGVHVGATWRIRLNRSCAAAMRLFYEITLTTCFVLSAFAAELIQAELHWLPYS